MTRVVGRDAQHNVIYGMIAPAAGALGVETTDHCEVFSKISKLVVHTQLLRALSSSFL